MKNQGPPQNQQPDSRVAGATPSNPRVIPEVTNIPRADVGDPFAQPRADVEQVASRIPIPVLKKAVDAFMPAERQVLNFTQHSDEQAMAVADEFIRRNNLHGVSKSHAANINLDNIDDPNGFNTLIETIAENSDLVQVSRRGTQTNEQTELLARELGMSVKELKGKPIGEAWNAEKITAARYVLATARDRVGALAEKIKLKQASGEEMILFRRALNEYAAVQMQVHGLAAEAGRALQAFRITAKSQGMLSAAQLDELMNNSGGPEVIEDMASRFIDLAAASPYKAARFARKAHVATTTDMIFEFWVNSLLSSPGTHMVNMTSNALYALWQVPERAMAALQPGSSVRMGEAVEQMYGMAEGLVDGFRAFWHVVKTEQPLDQVGKIEAREFASITGEQAKNKAKDLMRITRLDRLIDAGALDSPEGLWRGIDLLGQIARTPGRLLMAEDELFKSVGYRMELRAQAYRAAKNLSVADVTIDPKMKAKEIRDALADARSNPEAQAEAIEGISANGMENIRLAADDASRYVTFTKELGAMGRSANRAINSFPLGRFIMPFKRTPANIVKAVYERTPAAFLDPAIRADILAGGAKRDMALAKIELGSAVAGGLGYVVAKNSDCMNSDFCITGAPPNDPKMHATLARQGWQPYSIKWKGKYHAYNRLDPQGWTLGIVADAVRIMGFSNDPLANDDMGIAIVSAISKNAINKTYLSGVAEFMEVFTSYDDSAWEKYAQRFASSFVPFSSAQRQAQRIADPYRYKVEGMLESMCAVQLGCGADQALRRDLWGDPIKWSRGIYIYETVEKQNPVDREFLRLGYHPGMPNRTIEGVELTNKEYSDYVFLAGQGVKDEGKTMFDALKEWISSDEYVKGIGGVPSTDEVDPPGTKVKIINNVINRYREAAKAELMKANPDLVSRIAERKRDKILAVDPTNPITTDEIVQEIQRGIGL